MTRDQAFALVTAERDRQETLWADSHAWGVGSCASPAVAPEMKAVVLAEECGEVARAVLDLDHDNLRVELVQCAAVCIAFLESL